MKVGLFTALLAKLSFDEVIQKIKPLGISTVELGVGNYPGDPHLKLEWLHQAGKLKEFKQKLEDEGITISALSCHGNPLHPNKKVAQLHAATSKKAILLAAKLGVKTVIDFSGCPGDSDNSKYPNWSPTAWPPDFLEIINWQWEKKVIPYWTKHAKFAEDHGVRIGIEMHPGFVVYNPETMLRLREVARQGGGLQFRSQPHVLAGYRPLCGHAQIGRRACFTSTPRIPACTTSTLRSTAWWTPSHTAMRKTAPGSSAPSATATIKTSGAISFPHCK